MDQINQFDTSLLGILQESLLANAYLESLAVFVAQYLVLVLPITVLILWFWPKYYRDSLDPASSRKELLFSVVVAVLAWQLISPIIGEIWFRERPFEALIGSRELIFHRPSYSFPSDHALLLFTFAFALRALKNHFWYRFFLGLAILVGTYRVVTGLHWPTDIFGAVVLGYGAVLFADNYKDVLYKQIIERLYKVAKWLKLA